MECVEAGWASSSDGCDSDESGIRYKASSSRHNGRPATLDTPHLIEDTRATGKHCKAILGDGDYKKFFVQIHISRVRSFTPITPQFPFPYFTIRARPMASTVAPSHPEMSRRRASSISAAAPIGAPRARPHNNLHTPVTPQTTQGRDPYYGHEKIARICARFITHLFACPENPPTTGVIPTHGKLPFFIAYALHRTKLHPAVTYAALVLLQRLKARFPTARGSSGHRLFISAFMIASKVICDDTYSNKSWAIVAQGMFSLREVNQMEREMCGYLDWEINVDNEILNKFESALFQDFGVDRDSYPNYPNTMVSRRAARAAASTSNTPMPEPNSSTSPVPGFANRNKSPSKSQSPQSQPSSTSASTSPSPSWDTPDTPPSSYSNSSSPASTGSPRTPNGDEVSHPLIKGIDPSPKFKIDQVPPVHPLKGQMFAFAMPSLW